MTKKRGPPATPVPPGTEETGKKMRFILSFGGKLLVNIPLATTLGAGYK